jgi:hypothetical protein
LREEREINFPLWYEQCLSRGFHFTMLRDWMEYCNYRSTSLLKIIVLSTTFKIRPYCSEVWDTLGVGLSSRLQKRQNRAARIIMKLRYNTPGIEAINALGWEPLETRRAKSKVKQMYKF